MPVLVLDNGDVNDGYGRQPELKYETAMKAMSAMGYDAINVGEQDALLGSDYLRYVADFAKVPLLSANIVGQDGKPAFRPYMLKKISAAGTTISAAVIGIISPSFRDEIALTNPEWDIEDHMSVLDRMLPKLRNEADIVILLAHMNEDEAAVVAKRFPDIDLIVASHCGDDPFISPLYKNDVPIVFAGKGGTILGVAQFDAAKDGARFSAYSAEKLDDTLCDSRRIRALLDDYQQMLKAEGLLETYPRIKYGRATFTGNESCVRCHSLPTYRYQDDKHAHAFDVITKSKQEYDPECVQCHTVGFGYKSGFISIDETPDLIHVGCEDCHGPGSKHIENPLEETYSKVEPKTCESCHTLDNSPNFVYEEYLAKINHKTIFLCSAKVCHWFD